MTLSDEIMEILIEKVMEYSNEESQGKVIKTLVLKLLEEERRK